MIISQFAGILRCNHCGKTHGTDQWPANGDHVPFYYQREPGKHTLPVQCPHCGKEWYVVWDQDPGTIGAVWALRSSASPITNNAKEHSHLVPQTEKGSMIKFRCANCGKKIGVPEQYAGKKARCPGCQTTITIPPAIPVEPSKGNVVAPVSESACPAESANAGKVTELRNLAARLAVLPLPSDTVAKTTVRLIKDQAALIKKLTDMEGSWEKKQQALLTMRQANDRLPNVLGQNHTALILISKMVALASEIFSATSETTSNGSCAKHETTAARTTMTGTPSPRPSQVTQTAGLKELEMTCLRDDLLCESEYVEKATDMIASEGVDAAKALANLVCELLACRSPKIFNALTACTKAAPLPELLEAIAAVARASSLTSLPEKARFLPQIAGGGKIGWDDDMASRIRKYAREVFPSVRERQPKSGTETTTLNAATPGMKKGVVCAILKGGAKPERVKDYVHRLAAGFPPECWNQPLAFYVLPKDPKTEGDAYFKAFLVEQYKTHEITMDLNTVKYICRDDKEGQAVLTWAESEYPESLDSSAPKVPTAQG